MPSAATVTRGGLSSSETAPHSSLFASRSNTSIEIAVNRYVRRHAAFAQNCRRLLPFIEKAALYMLQHGTEAANWIRSQGSQTWPGATGTINSSPFAKK